MFDGLFSYWCNMRLKSLCEIASDMTLWFSAIPNFRKKMGKFATSIERSKAKSVSASGAKPPDSPTRGSAPGPRWGLHSQTFIIGSCSARLPCPPLPNPKYATVGLSCCMLAEMVSLGTVFNLEDSWHRHSQRVHDSSREAWWGWWWWWCWSCLLTSFKVRKSGIAMGEGAVGAITPPPNFCCDCNFLQ